MDDTTLEITRMLNAFPMGNSNPDLTLDTFELATASLSPQAVIEAAQRFITGDVQAQSKTFAPSVAEFVAEARRRQEFIDIKAKPRLTSNYKHTGTPFHVRQEKTRTKYRDCAVLAENIGLAEYQARVKEFPPGHALVCSVATVFGPPALEIASRK